MLWFDGGGGGEEAVWMRKEARATTIESFFLSILVVVCLDKSPFIALIRLKPIYLDLKLLFLSLCLCLLSLSGKLAKIWWWASIRKLPPNSQNTYFVVWLLLSTVYLLLFFSFPLEDSYALVTLLFVSRAMCFLPLLLCLVPLSAAASLKASLICHLHHFNWVCVCVCVCPNESISGDCPVLTTCHHHHRLLSHHFSIN